MDHNTRLDAVRITIRNIIAHQDDDSAVKVILLEEIQTMAQEGITQVEAQVRAQAEEVRASLGLPKATEAETPVSVQTE